MIYLLSKSKGIKHSTKQIRPYTLCVCNSHSAVELHLLQIENDICDAIWFVYVFYLLQNGGGHRKLFRMGTTKKKMQQAPV